MSASLPHHITSRPDTVRVGRDEITFRVTSAESAGAVAAFDVRMPPGGAR
jgi:hypothetical protein